MPFDGMPPRKQTLTSQRILRDLSQLLREPQRWPERFRWHYSTVIRAPSAYAAKRSERSLTENWRLTSAPPV
jgi:hypothetical protein